MRCLGRDEVNACLRDQCTELTAQLQDVCLAAVEGGRRIRAGLLLHAAQRTDTIAIKAACALEILHAATLLQDDIFDGGTCRRGKMASHLRFGKAQTILASDWLLIRSLELAAEVHSAYFKHLARTAASMAHAVANELAPLPARLAPAPQTMAIEIVHGKTAALFGSALYAAALLQDATHADPDQWASLGRQMGHLYQLLDDCMDIYAEPEGMGKEGGKDLESGRLTLPLLLACQSPGKAIGAKMRRHRTFTLKEKRQIEERLHSTALRDELQRRLGLQLAEIEQTAVETGLPIEALQAFTAEVEYKSQLCFHRECPSQTIEERINRRSMDRS